MAAVRILKEDVDDISKELEIRMIEWRHHLHEFPELSNRNLRLQILLQPIFNPWGLKSAHRLRTPVWLPFYTAANQDL
jgi:metal-dependent amidase/aminoacylase/carboxypeptidase family protein